MTTCNFTIHFYESSTLEAGITDTDLFIYFSFPCKINLNIFPLLISYILMHFPKGNIDMIIILSPVVLKSASGRGARVSACAGLINQLQSFRFDPRIACLVKLGHSNWKRLVDRGGGTPHSVLLTGANKSHLRCRLAFSYPTNHIY